MWVAALFGAGAEVMREWNNISLDDVPIFSTGKFALNSV